MCNITSLLSSILSELVICLYSRRNCATALIVTWPDWLLSLSFQPKTNRVLILVYQTHALEFLLIEARFLLAINYLLIILSLWILSWIILKIFVVVLINKCLLFRWMRRWRLMLGRLRAEKSRGPWGLLSWLFRFLTLILYSRRAVRYSIWSLVLVVQILISTRANSWVLLSAPISRFLG